MNNKTILSMEKNTELIELVNTFTFEYVDQVEKFIKNTDNFINPFSQIFFEKLQFKYNPIANITAAKTFNIQQFKIL